MSLDGGRKKPEVWLMQPLKHGRLYMPLTWGVKEERGTENVFRLPLCFLKSETGKSSPSLRLSYFRHKTAGLIFMIKMEYKESWAPKNWCFWTLVLEKTLENPMDCKEINPVNPKGNQSWIFIGRTNAEAETTILWPPDAKDWLTGKHPDAGKDWKQEEKGTTEEMVG